ncbi:hypothetical protein HU200_053559 [Digitaria exilis]|uniref:Uncharacterized protein n=1 Tax=Digitaria exilis TaxID=1010633 RepID=A0A835AM68_9POAL|nr:hypothetical protein HU200_053559 [Digitaria exilis]
MWAMLLHASMAQPPPAPIPPSECPSYCTSRCTPICHGDSDAMARRCSSIRSDEYARCFNGCAGQCHGNSGYARSSSCVIDSPCSPCACGSPCAQRCCKSCTGSADGAYSMCMMGQSKDFSYCLSSCTNVCTSECVNGTVFAP